MTKILGHKDIVHRLEMMNVRAEGTEIQGAQTQLRKPGEDRRETRQGPVRRPGDPGEVKNVCSVAVLAFTSPCRAEIQDFGTTTTNAEIQDFRDAHAIGEMRGLEYHGTTVSSAEKGTTSHAHLAARARRTVAARRKHMGIVGIKRHRQDTRGIRG